MRQCGSGEGEKPKHHYHRERDTQDEPLRGFLHLDFPFENQHDSDDGQHKDHRIVVEKLASDFSAESAEIEGSASYPFAMETEADETVLEVPIQNGETTKRGNQQRKVQVRILKLFPIENQDVKSHSDP